MQGSRGGARLQQRYAQQNYQQDGYTQQNIYTQQADQPQQSNQSNPSRQFLDAKLHQPTNEEFGRPPTSLEEDLHPNETQIKGRVPGIDFFWLSPQKATDWIDNQMPSVQPQAPQYNSPYPQFVQVMAPGQQVAYQQAGQQREIHRGLGRAPPAVKRNSSQGKLGLSQRVYRAVALLQYTYDAVIDIIIGISYIRLGEKQSNDFLFASGWIVLALIASSKMLVTYIEIRNSHIAFYNFAYFLFQSATVYWRYLRRSVAIVAGRGQDPARQDSEEHIDDIVTYEVISEAIPQLLVQSGVYIRTFPNFSTLQVLSILSSTLSIAVTYFFYVLQRDTAAWKGCLNYAVAAAIPVYFWGQIAMRLSLCAFVVVKIEVAYGEPVNAAVTFPTLVDLAFLVLVQLAFNLVVKNLVYTYIAMGNLCWQPFVFQEALRSTLLTFPIEFQKGTDELQNVDFQIRFPTKLGWGYRHDMQYNFWPWDCFNYAGYYNRVAHAAVARILMRHLELLATFLILRSVRYDYFDYCSGIDDQDQFDGRFNKSASVCSFFFYGLFVGGAAASVFGWLAGFCITAALDCLGYQGFNQEDQVNEQGMAQDGLGGRLPAAPVPYQTPYLQQSRGGAPYMGPYMGQQPTQGVGNPNLPPPNYGNQQGPNMGIGVQELPHGFGRDAPLTYPHNQAAGVVPDAQVAQMPPLGQQGEGGQPAPHPQQNLDANVQQQYWQPGLRYDGLENFGQLRFAWRNDQRQGNPYQGNPYRGNPYHGNQNQQLPRCCQCCPVP